MLEFEDYLEKSVEGKFGACYVTYAITAIDDETGEDISVLSVTGEKDEFIDFDAALSDEALEPIFEAFGPELDERFDLDDVTFEFEVKHIVLTSDNEDGSTTYFAVTPDGRTVVTTLTAADNFELLLESLLSE